MDFYIGTLGQVFIVAFFTLMVWLKVFMDAMKNRNPSLSQRKLLLTSLGLVLNATAIAAIMAFRIYELVEGHWPYVPYVSGFFVLLGVGNFLFIVSACIGSNAKLLRAFLIVSGLWTAFVIYASTIGFGEERFFLCEFIC